MKKCLPIIFAALFMVSALTGCAGRNSSPEQNNATAPSGETSITEIAELFNTSRSTIQYRRTSSFELLKKYLEENADEWDECYRILKPTGAFYCWGSSQMIDKLSVSLKVSRLYAKS
jgi:DNA modification methylase